MKVVTILTDAEAEGFTQFLKPSCDYFNLELIILQPEAQYTGHRLKDALLLKFLATLPQNEIILFTDGHDTAFMAGEEEILMKYETFKSPLVFSAEINCWPTPELERLYPASSYHFKYLNSGAFIGRAAYIIDLYKQNPLFSPKLKAEFSWSNQYFWHHVYLKNRGIIKLDHKCELFYNTATLLEKMKGLKLDRDEARVQVLLDMERLRLDDEIMFHNNRINYKRSSTFPCHLHFPGPISKLLMNSNFFEAIKVWSGN
jgi:hypothetical protein